MGGSSKLYQRTIKNPAVYTGCGLHTGKSCTVTLSPLGPGRGIYIQRADVPGHQPFKVTPESVGNTVRCTCLNDEYGNEVKTVEHVLAVLMGLQIDNILISVAGDEIPVGDGSSYEFVKIVESAGIEEQRVPAEFVVLDEPVYVSNGDRTLIAVPFDGFRVSAFFSDEHGVLGNQSFDRIITSEVFVNELSRARTIAFMSEIKVLQEKGLALGGDIDIAVIIDQNGYCYPPRYPDEPVRHKVLDLIGDMAGLSRLKAHIITIKGGHALNNALARQISAHSHIATFV